MPSTRVTIQGERRQRKGLLCNQDVLAMRTDFRSGEVESAGRAVAYVGTEALGE